MNELARPIHFQNLFGCSCPRPYPWHVDHRPTCKVRNMTPLDRPDPLNPEMGTPREPI